MGPTASNGTMSTWVPVGPEPREIPGAGDPPTGAPRAPRARELHLLRAVVVPARTWEFPRFHMA